MNRVIALAIVLVLLGAVTMSISETIKVYIDWDEDGYTEADLVGVVADGDATLGITDPDGRVAQVGLLSLTVDNADRAFSPLLASGAHYGDLLPGKPVQVTAEIDTFTYTLFTGTITRIMPASNLFGARRVTIEAVDRMDDFQRDTELTIPLQQDVTADALLKLIGAALYQTDAAEAEVYTTAALTTNDTVTINGQTYTFKDTLTPATYEVLIPNYWTGRLPGIWPETEHLANAINAGPYPDGMYGGDSLRHPTVVALGYPAIGVPDSERDSYIDLGDISTGYTGLGATFAFAGVINDSDYLNANEPSEIAFRRVRVPLWRVGDPTGRTLTFKLQLPNGANGEPSGTLAYTGAVTTLDAGSLSATAGSYIDVDFPAAILDEWAIDDVSQLYWVTVEIDGSPSGTNYVRWGADSGTGYGNAVRFRESHNSGAGWSATAFTNVPLLWVPGHCLLTAHAPGTWGNALTLTESSASLEVSGSTFSGGTDGPSGTLDYEAGVQTFAYAGDTWKDAEEFNAMVAIEQVVNSEFGLFAIGRDGQPVFKNKDYLFKAANETPFALDNTHATLMNPRIARDDARNIITVNYLPRNTIAHGTIAQTGRSYRVEPGTGTKRWSKYQASQPKETIFKLPIKDPATERAMAALSVDPLVGGTHYTVTTEAIPGSGVDVTSLNWGEITFAVAAEEIEVTVINRSNQVLYVHDLYFTGVGLVRYDQDQLVTRDETSISTYGKLPYGWTLPLQSGDVFIEALAEYLLRDPAFTIDGVLYDDPVHAGSAHLFSLDLFDLIAISDDQLAIDTAKYVIVGMGYQFAAGDVSAVTFFVRDVGTETYWLLGVTGFSELGETTRLAL